MTPDLPVKLCLLFALGLLNLPIAYLLSNGKRPTTGARRVGNCVAWCLIVGFPCALAIGYLDATAPSGEDFAAALDEPRWDWLVCDVLIGTIIALLGGIVISLIRGFHLFRPTGELGLPAIGPLWATRSAALLNLGSLQLPSSDTERARGGW